MTRRRLLICFATVPALCLSCLALDTDAGAAESKDRKLRIIAFGAHPDDAELKVGGTAIKWAQQGHQVKFVSVTNGDVGHWQIKGEELARRRLAETQAADKILGVETEVLPIHDGELEPTLENRRTITRLIRDWQADIVLCHRPWDYHPDHRYVGVLVQDAAFMVTVPFFCPDTPALKENPLFFYVTDEFQKPAPFRADVVVAIDDVFDRKVDALHELESQFYEGGASGSEEYVKPVPPASDVAAHEKVAPPEPLGDAECRRCQSIPRQACRRVRPGGGQEGQVRRGVRDLRVRPAAWTAGIDAAISAGARRGGRKAVADLLTAGRQPNDQR